MRYRRDIDGLRGVSIISVVLYHAQLPGFSGGFVGVDIFFVISGFLITGIIQGEIQNGSFTLADFYDRRIRRIFPAILAVYLFCLFAGLFVSMPEDLKNFGKSLTSSAFFVSNIHFYFQSGYFDSEALTKPLLHSWSLSVEEQFYLIWPLLTLAIWRFVPPTRRLQVIALGVILSLGYAEWEIERGNQPAAFYLLPARAWELLAGAALAIILPSLRIGPRVAEISGGLGVVLIAASVMTLSESRDFPGLNALFPCLGAVLLISAGQGRTSVATRIISNPALVLIGVISYSLYLWHWPLFSYWQLTFDRSPEMAEAGLLIAGSLVVATLSYRYIEQPFRRRRSIPGVGRTFYAGVAAMTVFIVAGAGLSASKGLPDRIDSGAAGEIFALAKHHEERDCSSNGEAEEGSRCMIGVRKESVTADVVLTGDSHANHFAPALDVLLEKYGLSGRLITKGGCLPVVGVQVFRAGREFTKCARYHEKLSDYINQGQVKLVVLAARWEAYSSDTVYKNDPIRLVDHRGDGLETADATKAVLERRLQEFVRKVQANGGQVLLVGQIPPYKVAPKNCVARARYYGTDPSKCYAPAADIRGRLKFSNDLLVRMAAQFEAVRTYIPSETLCGDKLCSLFLNEVFLYSDDDHLNSTGSREFAAALEQALIYSTILSGPAVPTTGIPER